MKTNNIPLNELKKMLDESRKQKDKKLLEGYLSEEDFDPEMRQSEGEFKEDSDDEKKTETDVIAQEKGILPIKNEIDQIRQIALSTIARLAENPVSESYQMMKKIWMMCDKAIETALQSDGGEAKKGSESLY